MATKKKTKVEEIMEMSGNGFHTRVVKLLREQKWTVLVSPYYSDNFTDKPREVDIIAEKKFPVYDFSTWLGTINVHLFIECKYINKDTIFWLDEKEKSRAIERVTADTGLEHLNSTNHHYISDLPVAKLFSSDKSRGDDYEPINKAINQNLNSLIYYRNRKNLFPDDPRTRNEMLKEVSYPLIVVNSFNNFYQTNMADDTGKHELITEPFQLEVNYAYIDGDKGGRNEYFLIDVVSIDKLTAFLAMIENNDVTPIRENVAFDEIRKRAQRQNQQNQRGFGNNSAR